MTDEAETRAYHVAIKAFTRAFFAELGDEAFDVLKRRTHEHTTMVIMQERDAGAVIRFTVDIGSVIPLSELKELMEAAAQNPGKVAVG